MHDLPTGRLKKCAAQIQIMTIRLCATEILAVLGYIVSLRFIVYVESNTTLVSLKLSKIMRPPARAPRHLPCSYDIVKVSTYLVRFVFVWTSEYVTNTNNISSNLSLARTLMIHAFAVWNSNNIRHHSVNEPQISWFRLTSC